MYCRINREAILGPFIVINSLISSIPKCAFSSGRRIMAAKRRFTASKSRRIILYKYVRNEPSCRSRKGAAAPGTVISPNIPMLEPCICSASASISGVICARISFISMCGPRNRFRPCSTTYSFHRYSKPPSDPHSSATTMSSGLTPMIRAISSALGGAPQ